MQGSHPLTPRLVRAGGIVVGGAVLMWVSLGVTLTMVVGRTNPDLALSWWPWGAVPKATQAAELAMGQEPSRAGLERAERLARQAILREPINVEAWRALAMVKAHQGKTVEADKLFAHAETLSRRDLPTELWQIEAAVRRGDVPGALTHYDRALRTSRAAPDLLLPALVAAADDPAIAQPLSKFLARRPNWWVQFMLQAIKDVKNAGVLDDFGRSLKLTLRDPQDADIANRIIDRLVSDRYYADALAYYGELTGDSKAAGMPIRDGEFNRDPAVLPFDWWFANDPDLAASREVFGRGDTRLTVHAGSGKGGEVARQLLVLSPGRYEVAGRAGVSGDQSAAQSPGLAIFCLGGASLLTKDVPVAGEGGAKFGFSFVVPQAGCAAQWLSVTTAPGAQTDAWVDGFAVRKLD